MENIIALKKQRQIIKAAFTRIFNYCDRENAEFSEVLARINAAEVLFQKYDKVQFEIDELTADTNMQAEEEYRANIETTYYSIKAKEYRARGDNITNQQQQQQNTQENSEVNTALQALVQHQSSMSILMERFANNIRTQDSSTPNEDTSPRELRLPRVNLPEFDGNILEWVRFKELFEAFVHNRRNLSNIEKLEYLNTKLKGDALLIIKHLNPTADNYAVAWGLLNKKYNNSDKIKSAYLELLFEQQAIKSPTLTEIKRFYNNINEGYNALKALDETVEQWNAVLLFNVEKKLDVQTATLWFRERKLGESSTFAKLIDFLERKVAELENLQERHRDNPVTKDQVNKDQQKRPQVRTYTTTNQVCPVCSSNHMLYQCDKFINSNVEKRRDIVKKANLCFNCLRGNHRASSCESRSCKKCDKKHNTLLHIQGSFQKPSNDKQLTTVTVQQDDPNPTNEDKHINTNMAQQNEQSLVILPTAIISVINNNNKYKCRALLDTGSQITLISEACVQRLGIKRKYDKTIIFGIGNQPGHHSRGKVDLNFSAIGQSKIIKTEALCLNQLTKILPAISIKNTVLEYFKDLKLADAEFYKEANVDIILGADVFMNCCLAETKVHPSGSISALNTIFGWVLMGRVDSNSSNHMCSNHISIDLDKKLQRFWEMEEMPVSQQQQLTPEELEAESHYEKTVQRLRCGRYEVRLPFKNEIINIGESKNIAFKRLQAMERKFKHNEQLKKDYKAFMDEYISLGHMQAINEECQHLKCFLPHHAVIKQSSTTSKIRVVFDASSKSSNGLSLNDNLLTGPKLQRDLFDILISFRMNEIAYVGDIEKMYRQISMNKDDRYLQCILWRENDLDEVQEYTLNTVTYGTAAASYLSTRTLNQITVDNKTLNPNTIDAIKNHFYVDDFMHSSENTQQAIKLKDELCNSLMQAGFHIRKWSSNSQSFLSTIPEEDKASSLDAQIQHTSTVATLGLMWNTKEDIFKFSSISYADHHVITKRTILSDIAKIYDPMGWISPTVIYMKIFMQKLWLRGVHWDEPLNEDLITDWYKIRCNIERLPEVKIKRWLQYDSNSRLELHGFSDASELAYAAAVYAKVFYETNKSFSYLIAAKTRVAPVKQVSLPRLELCAAHLLVKLMSRIRTSMGVNNVEMHGWTDSTIVLAWISDHPRRWKNFVANRTAQIIDVMPSQQWRHIRSLNNPADLATRGISTKDLINSKLWWHGPDELHQDIAKSLVFDNAVENCNLEERQKVVANTVLAKECGYIERFSNFSNLIRITALIFRFFHNCKHKQKHFGFISMAELRNAYNTIIKLDQQSSFSAEIKILNSNDKQLPTNHTLTTVAPFIDSAGILRVGGRLIQAEIPYDQKHPIILNKQSHLTKIIIRYYHLQHFHASQRLLQYIVQLKYWIPSITSVLKKIIYKCPICMRQRAKPYQQQMGELPKHRVVPAPVFSSVGIDFAGPFLVRAWKGRGGKSYKCWVAVFICLVTKAMHIELVTELSTATFVASLRRFIARRGKPLHVYTDNGTNFVGASHELKELFKFLQDDKNQDSIDKYLKEEQINWHFIPPGSPHFGGIWEAGVKSVKFHLKRVLKDAYPTFEEMYTVLCQIEGILNSRPLCIKFEGDIDPLTPAHFIILRSMATLPEINLEGVKENRLSRWQYIQRLVNVFWKKWSLEYLHQLQQRHKWKHAHQNVDVNQIVVIKDENTAPSHWLIGKIIKIHPGADGLTRVVTVKTKNGEIKRPIHKLCPLFLES